MTLAPPRPTAPSVGELAPDATLLDAAGAPRHLSDLWTSSPRALVLVFLRQFA